VLAGQLLEVSVCTLQVQASCP
jgi:alpha-glucosidase